MLNICCILGILNALFVFRIFLIILFSCYYVDVAGTEHFILAQFYMIGISASPVMEAAPSNPSVETCWFVSLTLYVA